MGVSLPLHILLSLTSMPFLSKEPCSLSRTDMVTHDCEFGVYDVQIYTF